MGKFNTYAALVWSPFHDKCLIFHSGPGNSSSNTSSTVTSAQLLGLASRSVAKFLERPATGWFLCMLAEVLTRLRNGSPLTPKASVWFCDAVFFHYSSHNMNIEFKWNWSNLFSFVVHLHDLLPAFLIFSFQILCSPLRTWWLHDVYMS